MTLKAAFTADEWATVEQAPLLAGAKVATAESGGTLSEGFAIKQVYAAARELRGESALLDEIVEDSPSLDLGDVRRDPNAIAASGERLRSALSILRQKVTADDLDAYKGFVLAVVQTAAEANREGGFAGIGGEEVSGREQAALDELTALLEQ